MKNIAGNENAGFIYVDRNNKGEGTLNTRFVSFIFSIYVLANKEQLGRHLIC
ncbi:hypothetical protein SAG0110_01730 [Streptococcus agalactiae BSU167]|nr:hypothetical protein SAG0110_01730 [Streptococcus agalactiae BSU167]